jgi:uncharacterized RDD family membrane protein YckC
MSTTAPSEAFARQHRAGFGIRFASYLIDISPSIIFTIVLVGIVVTRLGSVIAGGDAQAAQEIARRMEGEFVLYTYLLSFYSVGLWTYEIFTGRTLGKHLLGLKVAGDNMEPAEPRRIAVRNILKLGPALLGLINIPLDSGWIGLVNGLAGLAFLVGCFAVLGDGRQAWHDMWADLGVYRVKDLEGLRLGGAGRMKVGDVTPEEAFAEDTGHGAVHQVNPAGSEVTASEARAPEPTVDAMNAAERQASAQESDDSEHDSAEGSSASGSADADADGNRA